MVLISVKTREARFAHQEGGGMPPGGGGVFSFRNMVIGTTFCVALIGSAYWDSLKDDDEPHAPPRGTVPKDVRRVLPSGAWLMNDGTIVQNHQQSSR